MYWRFDAKKFALQQLPPFLRKKGIYALIKCFLTGIYWVYSLFSTHRETVGQQLNHNGTTASLEDLLNDKFSLSGEIYITDYVTNNTYIHMSGETKEDVYVGNQDEGDLLVLSSVSPDKISGGFAVNIPATLATDENIAVIRKWVDYYRAAGTMYKIDIYE